MSCHGFFLEDEVQRGPLLNHRRLLWIQDLVEEVRKNAEPAGFARLLSQGMWHVVPYTSEFPT